MLRMTTAIFGGTFDPFHKAHRRMIKAALKTGLLDTIYVIPAGAPPHKGRRDVSFSTYRYMMTKEALSKPKYERVIVSDYEIKKETTSFTISTVRYFKENILPPAEPLYLIIGSDSLLEFETWRDYPALLKEVQLLVAVRPGSADEEVLAAKKKRFEALYGARIRFYPMKKSGISSTAVREQLARGEEIPKSLPLEVRNFIDANYLYRDDPLSVLTEEQILELRQLERRLMSMLSPHRLVHSLNVMYEAVRLANRFGADPWKAARAGLLHDMVKEMDYKLYPEALKKIDPSFMENKAILHGPLGAMLLNEIFGIDDPAIRNAIYHHSSLSPIPAPLEKIIFLADKIEPARDYGDLEPIRQMARKDLDRAVVMTIDGSISGIRARGGDVHKDTLSARSYLLNKIQERDRPGGAS